MDDAEIASLTEKPNPVTKRNWILLKVDDEESNDKFEYPSEKLKLAFSDLPNTNIGTKINGINTLNDYVVDYYRRRFGGDLTSRPMSTPSNTSPHSFRRFSSTSIDQLTLKSKFQALQWKFRHQPPLTVITGAQPPSSVATTDGSTSPSFRRKAGRLVDESFGFIDSELKKSRKKYVPNANANYSNRKLHRTEFEIQLPSLSSERDETIPKNMTTNFQSRNNNKETRTKANHLVEYSSNDGEVYAVYAKRHNQDSVANDLLAHQRRNVQFDDQIRVVERYHPDMQVSTGGFVRQLCAIVKPHKRGGEKEYYSSKLNVISAYSPSINAPKPISPADLESSFYSAAKSCTLPSLPPDGSRSPEMDITSSNNETRDLYSADVDQASITENPAFRDELNANNGLGGSKSFVNHTQLKNHDEIVVTHETDSSRPRQKVGTDNRSVVSMSSTEPLKSKSFFIAICIVVLLLIMTGIGVGFTIYYD